MLFNSLDFCLFLPLVWLVFRLLPKGKLRQWWILAASLFFYGYWNWAYLLLLIFTSTLDFLVARKLEKSKGSRARKGWLWASISTNILVLGYFKYGLFFGHQFVDANFLNETPAWLQVMLPVGISFYTFQAMAYVIDVYRHRLPAEKSYPDFLLFISFFPQLVAGPIERAPHLLGQLKRLCVPDDVQILPALYLVLGGFWKKIFLADRLGVYVDAVFNKPEKAHGPEIIMATIFFGFQIYGDFSGYSDIARGVARLFGVDLMLNFNRPYLANSLQDFWRRWHISLSGWFRDYVYHPMGGNKTGQTNLNLLIVFALSGFWHGANWTFLLWGLWHAIGLVVERNFWKQAKGFCYSLVVMAWVFAGWLLFRINSMADLRMIVGQLRHFQFQWNNHFHSWSELSLAVLGIGVLMLFESVNQKDRQGSEKPMLPNQWAIRLVMGTMLLLWLGKFKGQDFIYFQF